MTLASPAAHCAALGFEPKAIVISPDPQYAFGEINFAVLCVDPMQLPTGTMTVYVSALHASEPNEMVFTLSDGQKLDLPSIGMGSSVAGVFTGLADTTYSLATRAPLGNRFIMYCHRISSSSATATLTTGNAPRCYS